MQVVTYHHGQWVAIQEEFMVESVLGSRYLSEMWLLQCIRHGGQGISGVLKLFAVKWFSGPSYLCTCYCVDLGLGWMRLEMWMTQWVDRYTCMHCYWWSCLFNACRDTLCPGTKHATFRFQGSLSGSIPQLTLWDDGWDGSVCSCISTPVHAVLERLSGTDCWKYSNFHAIEMKIQ